MAEPSAPDLAQNLSALRRALNTGRVEDGRALAGALLAQGMALRPLARLFQKSDKLGVLVDAAWDHRQTAFRRFSSIAEFLRLCDETGMAARGDALILELAAGPAPTFSVGDYLGRGTGDARLLALFKIKYRGWNDGLSLPLAERVEALAQRCETPAELLEEVARRTGPNAPPDWRREMDIDQAYGHVFRDANIAGTLLKRLGENADPFLTAFRHSLTQGLVETLADIDESRRRFADLDRSRGLVLATAHNLFSRIEVTLARAMLPDSYAIHLQDLAGPAGHRDAAFRALNTVRDGKAVVIAADGGQASANASVQIEVLGQPTRVSIGAALIAYEGQSPTVFYRTARTGRRFAPVFSPGPRRLDNESFAAFRTRWLAFYAVAREAALLASPGDLAFFLRNQRP
jgi:hypothetical protein